MLAQFARPGHAVAVVSDSYDIYRAVDQLWGVALKDAIVASGATLVVRPDSGEPVEVVSTVMKLLANRFGTTLNRKGYRVLNQVRVIQGDGVDEASIGAILRSLRDQGFAADNIAFGMGGALLHGWIATRSSSP